MLSLPKTVPSFFWRYIRVYRARFLALVGVACLWALYTSLNPYCLKLIIDAVAETEIGLVSSTVWPYAVAYVALMAALVLNARLYDFVYLQTVPPLQQLIYKDMFVYLERHSHTYFQNHLAGNLANKIHDMAWGFGKLMEVIFDTLLTRLLAVAVAVAAMSLVHPIFGAILAAWAILFVGITVKLSKRAKRASTVSAEQCSRVIGRIIDSVSNIGNVRLFSRHDEEVRVLDRALAKLRKADQRLLWKLLWVKAIQGITVVILIAALIVFLISARAQGWVTIGDFAMILGLAKSVVEAVWDLASVFVNAADDLGACQQAIKILTVEHGVKDVAHAQPIEVLDGKIEFKNVTFNYRHNDNIFRNKTLTIGPRERVGLVGYSGSGKTTFVNLIMRVFDVNGGEIRIDGQNIADVQQDTLRENICFIPQDVALFHRSIMDNIRYGRHNASDEEVIEAAKKAHCHEFIEKLEYGYQSHVGERGLKLSGGQRQRIAIARALLKPRPIIILDEATSALDSVTEKTIQEVLQPMMQARTAIVITHRLATLVNMDRILVFKGGEIVESGSHDALIAQGGHYAELWQHQTHGMLPEAA